MENIIHALSKTVHSVASTSGAPGEVKSLDKNAILSMIDNTIIAVDAVLAASMQSKLDAYIRKETKVLTPIFDAAYKLYSKKLGTHEGREYFSKLIQAMVVFKKDLVAIQENFGEVFSNGTNEGDITIEQIRTSHASVIGYIKNIGTCADWYGFMISLVKTPGDNQRVPDYRPKFVEEQAHVVAATVRYANSRHSKKTILDDVTSMKKEGHDLFLISGGKPLAEYAHEKDFSGPIQGFLGGFNILTPILWVTDLFYTIQRYWYDHNKTMREWMLAKMAVIQMTLNGVPPTDPEYERWVNILNKYSTMIAEYDRQIAEYENRF